MASKPFVSNVAKGIITKDNVKDIKKEMSKLASMANKRLQRLEKAGLQDTPTYQKWFREGANKFGVKGKDHNQLQKELSRLKNFINSETSTIKGINNVLKDMANSTGIKYKNLADLRAKSTKFFELRSKTEQYLRNVDDSASAFTSTRLFEEINKYVASANIDLASSEVNIEDLVEKVSELLTASNASNSENTYESDPDGWWFE